LMRIRKMKNTLPFDTIAAVSTPPGEGGIGIVRLSGDRAVEIVRSLFSPLRKRKEDEWSRSFTMRVGLIRDGKRTIDEVLVSVMKAPHTYTREDVVEINCHGGAVAVNEVLRLVLYRGARAAEPGEFTKRAFINGRIDLAQAEAVLDIVQAKTPRALESGVKQLRGGLSGEIVRIAEELRGLLVRLEAEIDFPEEDDVSSLSSAEIERTLRTLREELSGLIKSYDTGKILKTGVLTVIAGKPNVGKSSILNAFLKFDRAIVTPIPGTTRDIIEEQLNIGGIPFILADTAGITETDDVIEREGVRRTNSYLEKARLALIVLDSSRPLDRRDRDIAERTSSLQSITILNKSDLPRGMDAKTLVEIGLDDDYISMSALTGEGLKELEERMREKIVGGKVEADHGVLVTDARHFAVLRKAARELDHALKTIREDGGPELIAFDVRSSLDILGNITGEVTSADILNDIFGRFCIGK